jgi:hypothetical protein
VKTIQPKKIVFNTKDKALDKSSETFKMKLLKFTEEGEDIECKATSI